jgi:hypothetical protein
MHLDDHGFAVLITYVMSPDHQLIANICPHRSSLFPPQDHHLAAFPAEHRAERPLTRRQAGGSSSRSGIGGLGAGEFMPAPAGIDQRTRLVIDGGACSRQGGPAHAVVVAAQQQVNRVPAGSCRRHHHRDHRPGRTAASAPSKSKRFGPVTRVVHGIPVQEPCPHTKERYTAAILSIGT